MDMNSLSDKKLYWEIGLCVKGKSRTKYGRSNQVVIPGSEKGARLVQAYFSETGIFGKQVPF
jgi:hypothetical protein